MAMSATRPAPTPIPALTPVDSPPELLCALALVLAAAVTVTVAADPLLVLAAGVSVGEAERAVDTLLLLATASWFSVAGPVVFPFRSLTAASCAEGVVPVIPVRVNLLEKKTHPLL